MGRGVGFEDDLGASKGEEETGELATGIDEAICAGIGEKGGEGEGVVEDKVSQNRL